MKSNAKANTTRRTFLTASATLAIGLSSPGWAQTRGVGGDALARLDESLARALIDSEFGFSDGAHRFQTRLEAVDSSPVRVRKGGVPTQSFSMAFVVAGRLRATEGLYQVDHAQLGHFELFVTPHANAKGESILLAIFNRL